eukprot:m.46953 g.46953  ORF g.46953 m.46953 type:complete len:960 (+) comp10430_c0_seq2:186-3065(+)
MMLLLSGKCFRFSLVVVVMFNVIVAVHAQTNTTAEFGPTTTQNTTTLGILPGETLHNCQCKAAWSQECCANRSVTRSDCDAADVETLTFYGCGMETPCDGDFRDPYPTWCFVEDGCDGAFKSNDISWDYCYPQSTTSTTVTTTPPLGSTLQGCACKDNWNTTCSGDLTTFYKCGMEDPCDGQVGQGSYTTWCEVEDDCTTSKTRLDGTKWDYCVPDVYDFEEPTMLGCQCARLWSPDCKDAFGESLQFEYCGMRDPCDGDNSQAGTRYSSWCFVDGNCGNRGTPAWDYCHPPPLGLEATQSTVTQTTQTVITETKGTTALVATEGANSKDLDGLNLGVEWYFIVAGIVGFMVAICVILFALRLCERRFDKAKLEKEEERIMEERERARHEREVVAFDSAGSKQWSKEKGGLETPEPPRRTLTKRDPSLAERPLPMPGLNAPKQSTASTPSLDPTSANHKTSENYFTDKKASSITKVVEFMQIVVQDKPLDVEDGDKEDDGVVDPAVTWSGTEVDENYLGNHANISENLYEGDGGSPGNGDPLLDGPVHRASSYLDDDEPEAAVAVAAGEQEGRKIERPLSFVGGFPDDDETLPPLPPTDAAPEAPVESVAEALEAIDATTAEEFGVPRQVSSDVFNPFENNDNPFSNDNPFDGNNAENTIETSIDDAIAATQAPQENATGTDNPFASDDNPFADTQHEETPPQAQDEVEEAMEAATPAQTHAEEPPVMQAEEVIEVQPEEVIEEAVQAEEIMEEAVQAEEITEEAVQPEEVTEEAVQAEEAAEEVMVASTPAEDAGEASEPAELSIDDAVAQEAGDLVKVAPVQDEYIGIRSGSEEDLLRAVADEQAKDNDRPSPISSDVLEKITSSGIGDEGSIQSSTPVADLSDSRNATSEDNNESNRKNSIFVFPDEEPLGASTDTMDLDMETRGARESSVEREPSGEEAVAVETEVVQLRTMSHS